MQMNGTRISQITRIYTDSIDRVSVFLKKRTSQMLHAEITDKIIYSFYKVHNTLGYGFLEKVYENALIIELKRAEMNVSCLLYTSDAADDLLCVDLGGR